jgi:hypothetical protein
MQQKHASEVQHVSELRGNLVLHYQIRLIIGRQVHGHLSSSYVFYLPTQPV